jgi:putative tryptophan/tyrosine transport system substrate-binding protein
MCWAHRKEGVRRRDFITLFGGAAATWPLAARAQADHVRRIGVLMGLDANDQVGQSEVRALKQGLQELGWMEGRNLQIEYGWAGGEPGRIQASAKELVGLKCEVIAARSTPAVAALLKETRAIPIVFTYVFDPVGSGFVRSFARPEGNVTGFQTYEPTIVGKWLQILLEVAPSLRRVAFIYNPTTTPPGFVHAFETLAHSAPVQLVAAPVHNSAEIDGALAGLAHESGGGLMMVADTFNDANHVQIVALAAKHSLPAIYPHRFDDALITYGPDLSDLLRRAASYVDRILQGEKPGELPVQAPTKYELIVNLKIAKALGLIIPPSLLVVADDVIQ